MALLGVRAIFLDIHHVVDQVDRAGSHAKQRKGPNHQQHLVGVSPEASLRKGDRREDENVLDPLLGTHCAQQLDYDGATRLGCFYFERMSHSGETPADPVTAVILTEAWVSVKP